MSRNYFPKEFYWGAATSSHQIEGGQNNNWTRFENENADRLARESESNFHWNPHWEKFRDEAENPENYLSGRACYSWDRYEEDHNIIKELGLNAYRFSVEWSRIEPEEGKFNEEALNIYRRKIQSLRIKGIEPFVTLWHWTLPLWLADRGGFSSPEFPKFFARYSRKVAEFLCANHYNESDKNFQNKQHGAAKNEPNIAPNNEINIAPKFWITLNEPLVVASHSYLKGFWPPQKKSKYLYYRAVKNLIKAHKDAYSEIKKINPSAQIGVAKHQVAFEMAKPSLKNKILKFFGDYSWNFYFLNKIRSHQDFIGLNHYNRNFIDGGYGKNPNEMQTDFGWEYYPESLYQSINDLKKYKKPIYVTESGIADHDDDLRPEFIERAIESVGRAISDGADVRGYFYWSLLDNFEWDKGYWLKFGIVSVNRKTGDRKIKGSGWDYRDIVKNFSQIS